MTGDPNWPFVTIDGPCQSCGFTHCGQTCEEFKAHMTAVGKLIRAAIRVLRMPSVRSPQPQPEPKGDTPAMKLLGVDLQPPCSCPCNGDVDPFCWHHGVVAEAEGLSINQEAKP